MKIAQVARADDRGLGLVSWEFHRAMRPERVLVVREPGAERLGYEPHLDRYPGATVVTFHPVTGALPEAECRAWLRGADVVYGLETSYDPHFFAWARDEGVRSVCHAMPEFWRDDPNREPPDEVWNPTTWRHDTLPEGSRVVPVPVAADRFTQQSGAGRFTWVHVAGKRAAMDRNGTQVVAEALRFLRQPQRVIVRTQDGSVPRMRPTGRVELQVKRAATDYWSLYDGADALVLPRRYAGLSLPIQEAMAAGLAVVGTDREPDRSTWPILPVNCRQRGHLDAPGGRMTLDNVDPKALAAAMDEVASTGLADKLRAESVEWARTHSWDALRPLYEEEFARVLA